MKLPVCLLLAVVATVSADEGFYQPQAVAQPAAEPNPASYSYYDYEYAVEPPKKEGWLDRLLGSNRRQGLAALLPPGLAGLASGPVIGVVVAVIVVVVVVVTLSYLGTVLSSSGRGLHADQWEVDHSAWMDQLHTDFEDSWEEQ